MQGEKESEGREWRGKEGRVEHPNLEIQVLKTTKTKPFLIPGTSKKGYLTYNFMLKSFLSFDHKENIDIYFSLVPIYGEEGS